MTKLNLKVIDMENSIVEFAKAVIKLQILNPAPFIANPHRLREPP